MNDKRPLLQCAGIVKTFPGVKALKGVDLEVKEGKIVGLVGANGAGKSTLVNVIIGNIPRDEGRILFDGKEVNIKSPREALNLGIGVVPQEIKYMPHFTVAQHLFLGRELKKRTSLDDRKMEKEAGEILREMKIEVSPNSKMGELTASVRQRVEIAKALSQSCRLILLDEPTSTLAPQDAESLFSFLKELSEIGTGFVFISHRIKEVLKICERIFVLRDGKNAGVFPNGVKYDDIVKAMVGEEIRKGKKEKRKRKEEKILLRVKKLTGPKFKNIDLELKAEEILGLAGLVGAGRSELAMGIFGAIPQGGSVEVEGYATHIRKPQDALEAGIGLVPEDARGQGLIPTMSVRENMSLLILNDISRPKSLGWFACIDKGKEEELCNSFVKRTGMKIRSLNDNIMTLSGGNQKKALMSKWLLKGSKVLMLDEPTAGIDVKAKADLYDIMEKIAQEGKGIVFISSETDELLECCDRIAVMAAGAITGILDSKEATNEKIMSLAARI